MLFAAAAIAFVGLVGSRPTAVDETGARLVCDTVQAGEAAISSKHSHGFTVLRRLMLTRSDSTRPFGTQMETLTSTRLNGRPTLLDVLVFDTPRGKTVDSSWVDQITSRPRGFDRTTRRGP